MFTKEFAIYRALYGAAFISGLNYLAYLATFVILSRYGSDESFVSYNQLLSFAVLAGLIDAPIKNRLEYIALKHKLLLGEILSALYYRSLFLSLVVVILFMGTDVGIAIGCVLLRHAANMFRSASLMVLVNNAPFVLQMYSGVFRLLVVGLAIYLNLEYLLSIAVYFTFLIEHWLMSKPVDKRFQIKHYFFRNVFIAYLRRFKTSMAIAGVLAILVESSDRIIVPWLFETENAKIYYQLRWLTLAPGMVLGLVGAKVHSMIGHNKKGYAHLTDILTLSVRLSIMTIAATVLIWLAFDIPLQAMIGLENTIYFVFSLVLVCFFYSLVKLSDFLIKSIVIRAKLHKLLVIRNLAELVAIVVLSIGVLTLNLHFDIYLALLVVSSLIVSFIFIHKAIRWESRGII